MQSVFQFPLHVHCTGHHCSTLESKFVVVATVTLKVLVTTIDVQWEGMGNVGSVRYEPALLPPYPTKGVLSY